MAGQLKKKSEKSGRGQPSQTSKNPEIGTEVSENESEAAVNEKDVTKNGDKIQSETEKNAVRLSGEDKNNNIIDDIMDFDDGSQDHPANASSALTCEKSDEIIEFEKICETLINSATKELKKGTVGKSGSRFELQNIINAIKEKLTPLYVIMDQNARDQHKKMMQSKIDVEGSPTGHQRRVRSQKLRKELNRKKEQILSWTYPIKWKIKGAYAAAHTS